MGEVRLRRRRPGGVGARTACRCRSDRAPRQGCDALRLRPSTIVAQRLYFPAKTCGPESAGLLTRARRRPAGPPPRRLVTACCRLEPAPRGAPCRRAEGAAAASAETAAAMNSPPAGLAWLFYVYFGVMVVAVGLSIGLASYHPSMPGFVLVVSGTSQVAGSAARGCSVQALLRLPGSGRSARRARCERKAASCRRAGAPGDTSSTCAVRLALFSVHLRSAAGVAGAICVRQHRSRPHPRGVDVGLFGRTSGGQVRPPV